MLSRARSGTFLTFALAGLVCGVWVARMPALKDKFDLSPGSVGIVLLCWGVAAVIAMQGLRGVIARTGSRKVLIVAAPLTAVTGGLLALAPSYPVLLVTTALYGMSFGMMDVSMNAQASVVERAYKRPLMSGMHAGWCVGAMSGGLFGAASAALGMTFTQALLAASIVSLPAALYLGRTYLPDPVAVVVKTAEGVRRSKLPVLVYLLGALAFLAFMAEGAVADWSGLLLQEHLHATEALAALGYPMFEAAMLCGRLIGDRVRTRLGTRRLLTAAGLGTAASMGIVLAAPALPVALAGFFLTGLMICTVVPTMISMAGTVAPGRSAASVAQVGAMGYGGLLLGPVVIGFLAEASSVHFAMSVIAVLALAVAAGSRLLPARTSGDLATLHALPQDDRELLAA